MTKILFFCTALVAWSCSAAEDMKLKNMGRLDIDMAFVCVHEEILDPVTDVKDVFKYARWLEINNQLRQEVAVYAEVERLYRIASENGGVKATINIMNGSIQGMYRLSEEEYLRFSEYLVGEHVGAGFYIAGVLLENGLAGLKKDPEVAMRYFRKAADLGNNMAQARVASLLAPKSRYPEVARKMRQCAAEQGNGDAAIMLGFHLQMTSDYASALAAFQLGVAAGDETAALALQNGFANPDSEDRRFYIGQEVDTEREARYAAIRDVLSRWSYADPKVPEINDIVPLPPAKLPPWDGKLQWVEERLANIPPPKPSDELLRKLTDAKKLEFDTGKPMPGHPAFTRIQFPTQFCLSGQPCPKTGYWRTHVYYKILDGDAQGTEFIQRFEAGEIMPKKTVEYLHYRSWPRRDKVEIKEEVVEWALIG